VAVLYLGDGGGYEGMRQHVFDASWGVVGRGFYRAFIKRGAQVFYGQVYLQFLLKSDDSIRICKRGKFALRFWIRASTPGQLHITLGPWFRLLRRHGAVLKGGWRAADGSRWARGATAVQGFRRLHVALQPWAEWAAT
jgi:hypothetical protein